MGDSYDFAVLLTSFLLGAGYDAFVVSGTAPRWVTLRDMSRSKCPLIVAEAVAQEAKDAEIAAQVISYTLLHVVGEETTTTFSPLPLLYSQQFLTTPAHTVF